MEVSNRAIDQSVYYLPTFENHTWNESYHWPSLFWSMLAASGHFGRSFYQFFGISFCYFGNILLLWNVLLLFFYILAILTILCLFVVFGQYFWQFPAICVILGYYWTYFWEKILSCQHCARQSVTHCEAIKNIRNYTNGLPFLLTLNV